MKITTSDYQELAERTESMPDDAMVFRMSFHNTLRLLHAGMGMTTEAGEFLDGLKKHIFYGKSIDAINLEEEIGDLMWYVALACNALGVDLDRLLAQNIRKLAIRYPDKFKAEDAINRDLDAERKSLES